MNGALTIEEIANRLKIAAGDLTRYCTSLSDEQFFRQPVDKWSPAQQTKHLVKSTDTARLAFTLPKFLVRWIGGKPNRPSRTYDDLVARYKQKLEQGGKASGRYIPKPIPVSYGRERLLQDFERSMKRFARALVRNRTEPDLERYIAPHPLLGKITLRELCYFTIHHSYHHLESIKKIAG